MYSFVSTQGIEDEKHRTNMLSYVDSLIEEFNPERHEEADTVLAELKELRNYLNVCPTREVLKEPFLAAYIECALWSSTDDEGEPLDDNYFYTDLDQSALDSMKEDCEDFVTANGIPSYGNSRYTDAEMAGHDFWLTRNGHGAGFWDRGLPKEIGDKFTEASEAYGSCDLYVGDDHKIYCT